MATKKKDELPDPEHELNPDVYRAPEPEPPQEEEEAAAEEEEANDGK